MNYSLKVDKQYTKDEEVPMTYYKFTKYISRFLIGAYGKKKSYVYYSEMSWLVISFIFALYELCFNKEIIVFIGTIIASYLVYVYYKKRELLFK